MILMFLIMYILDLNIRGIGTAVRGLYLENLIEFLLTLLLFLNLLILLWSSCFRKSQIIV